MESKTTCFIAQLKGRVTKHRYKYATVFTDHFSDYTYVHLQELITSAETLSAKRAPESKCKSYGIPILHYHCNSVSFADNVFKNALRENGQTVTYCGVKTNFQNGQSEKKIGDLREAARTQLIHAINRCTGAVKVHLCAYAIRYACNV